MPPPDDRRPPPADVPASGSWDSYFYPPPDSGTLRNLFDERDREVLARLEYVETVERQRELLAGEVAIARTYDGDHLRAIHHHLFQDVYPWAGQYRTVNISKGHGGNFADITTGEIDRYLSDVHLFVVSADWDNLDREEFARRAAVVFAYLNQAHPFREGNGRTAKVFMDHVAEQSHFEFDYARVSPEVWNQRSMLSGPDAYDYSPHPQWLTPVFVQITMRRQVPPATGIDETRAQRIAPPAESTPYRSLDYPHTSSGSEATSHSSQRVRRAPDQDRGHGPEL